MNVFAVVLLCGTMVCHVCWRFFFHLPLLQPSRINPPLLSTQFGKRSFADVASQQSMRDPYFNVVYNVTENSINTNDVLRVR